MAVQSLLNTKIQEVKFNLSQLWVNALTGKNEFADIDLFAALEAGDFVKAKQIYQEVFGPVFEVEADHQEAA